MVRKSHGPHRRTRRKLKSRKKPTITKFLQEFSVGDKVVVDIEPSERGFPHPRFQGIVGNVISKRGSGYVVRLKDKNAIKVIITKPVHLKKV